jgi:hypothetical protein
MSTFLNICCVAKSLDLIAVRSEIFCWVFGFEFSLKLSDFLARKFPGILREWNSEKPSDLLNDETMDCGKR